MKTYSHWIFTRHSYNYIYNTHNMGLNTNVQLIYHWDVHTEYTHTQAQQVHNCLMYNSKKTHMQSHSPKIHILQISEHTRNLHSLLNPHIHQNTHLITPGTPITHRHKPPTLIKYSWTSNNLGYRVPTLHSVENLSMICCWPFVSESSASSDSADHGLCAVFIFLVWLNLRCRTRDEQGDYRTWASVALGIQSGIPHRCWGLTVPSFTQKYLLSAYQVFWIQ